MTGVRDRLGRRGLGGDRGSVCVWWAVALAAVTAVFLAVLARGTVAAARHRAGAAADLAALAAAERVAQGVGSACGVARRVAAEHGARLVRCQVEGSVVDLTVRLVASGSTRWVAVVGVSSVTPVARARAGPPGAVR